MILIDGHNCLFKLYPDVDSNFHKTLESFIYRVREVSDNLKKKIILVLDGTGGRSIYGSKTQEGAYLEVIYSGHDLSADDWIENWIDRNKGVQIELITADKKLVDRVKRKSLKSQSPQVWFKQQEDVSNGGKRKVEFGDLDYWLKEFGES